MPSRTNRLKISTTVAPETGAFLKSLVHRGTATNLAEAVDHVVAIARRAESRKKLDDATAAYYASLPGKTLRHERTLERALSKATAAVDFDGE